MYYNYHNRLKKLLKEENYICIKEKGKFAYRFIFPRLMKSMHIREYREEKVEKLLKKVDKIVENINTDYLLKKIKADEEHEQEFELLFFGVDCGEGESMSALSRKIETENKINDRIKEFMNYTYKGSD